MLSILSTHEYPWKTDDRNPNTKHEQYQQDSQYPAHQCVIYLESCIYIILDVPLQ